MDDEPVGTIQRKAVAKLLDGPFRRGVLGEIPVDDTAGGDVEADENVELLKGGRHHGEEVAGEYSTGVIAEERSPRLGRLTTTTSRPWRHVASHCTWRHGQTKLQAELCCDALLTPGAVL